MCEEKGNENSTANRHIVYTYSTYAGIVLWVSRLDQNYYQDDDNNNNKLN